MACDDFFRVTNRGQVDARVPAEKYIDERRYTLQLCGRRALWIARGRCSRATRRCPDSLASDLLSRPSLVELRLPAFPISPSKKGCSNFAMRDVFIGGGRLKIVNGGFLSPEKRNLSSPKGA